MSYEMNILVVQLYYSVDTEFCLIIFYFFQYVQLMKVW